MSLTPENTAENGKGWNKEDFSILGPDAAPWAQGVRWMTFRDSEGNGVLMESLG